MVREHVFLLLLMSLIVLTSCRDDGRAEGLLRTVDSLMEGRPDSSLALLSRDSAVFARSGKAVRMSYTLSKTEAEDKCYIPHRSDSAMLPVAEYFAGHGTPLQHVRSQYVLGRVYCDLRLYGHALTAFDNALAVKTEGDPATCRYKARAAIWSSAIYEEKGLYSDALRYNKLAYCYARNAYSATLEVYTLRDIGRTYSNLNKNDIAIKYYLHAAKKAVKLNNSYLHNMVMEELASIYMDEKMFSEALKALSTPFNGTLNEDIAPHYFVWATYFDKIGKYDSAIIYNKKGLLYGDLGSNISVSLSLARLYKKLGRLHDAIDSYELYTSYNDSLTLRRSIENSDFLDYVEKNIDAEKRNAHFAETQKSLVLLILTMVVFVSFAIIMAVRFYYRKRNMYETQHERTKRYWEQIHEQDLSNIKKNESRIRFLENKLSASAETLTELEKKLLRAEMDMLDKQNEQMLSEQRHKDLLVAEFQASSIYEKFHQAQFVPANDDLRELEKALNMAYDRFVFRLKDLYPTLRFDELYICCLVKIGLMSKEICGILGYKANKVSMTKVRLYQKIFKKKGTVSDFDNFIRKF